MLHPRLLNVLWHGLGAVPRGLVPPSQLAHRLAVRDYILIYVPLEFDHYRWTDFQSNYHRQNVPLFYNPSHLGSAEHNQQ